MGLVDALFAEGEPKPVQEAIEVQQTIPTSAQTGMVVIKTSQIAWGVFWGMTAYTIIGGIVFALIWAGLAH
jgi:hypothetical protein